MSSSVIGALRVNLGLDSAQFQKGLKQSQSGLAAFGKKMAVVGAGIAAAGATAFAAFNNSANRLTDLQKQADIAGLSAQEFKIAALAVEQYGVSQEKLSDILKDVNDKFGDFAATGGGPLADFFENIAPKVGLTIDSFRNLSSSDALALYITSLEKANVSQQEMTFYMEALANDATALIPAFRDGGKAIDEMAVRAKELGLAIDENLIKSAREAQGDIRLISEVLRTQFDQAVLKLGPSLTQLASALMPVVEGLGALILKVLEWTDVAGKGAREVVDKMIAGFQALPGVATEPMMRLAAALAAGFSTLAQQAVEWGRGVIQAIVESLRGLYEAGVQAVKDLAAGMAAEFVALKERAIGWGSDIVDGLTGGLRSAGSRVRGAVTGLADTVKGVFTDEVEIQSPSKVFQRFGMWITEGLANGIGAGAGMAAGSMQGLADNVVGAGQKLSDSLSGVFKEVISGTKTLPLAIGDMLSNIANQLMSSGLDSLFSSLFGGLFGGGDPLTSALRGAGLSAIPGFANGGYHGGGLRIVGENGPELEATGPARYFNASQTQDMLSGGGGKMQIEILPSELFDVRMREESEGAASRMGMQINSALPSRVQQIQAKPRRR